MNDINFKKEVISSPEGAVEKITRLLGEAGFGILTRIDFHAKIKEKLGKNLRPVIILGACNPKLAFEAFNHNSDTASLIPCNVVVRELAANKVSVEVIKPTSMLSVVGDRGLSKLAEGADLILAAILDQM